jgi:alpha-methylacyl-CoA racemase
MGPLEGVRIVEVASLAAGPFGAMVLADLGADVLRIERPGAADHGNAATESTLLLNRGRRSVAIDLKKPEGVDAVLRLTETADVLLEGFRPGVMERLGLGPDVCLERNPRLIYGRITGWGQSGPLAHVAGHDINFIALAGALHGIGRRRSGPVPPLNLVGDFAGGGMLLVIGVLAALLERQRSGKGQVIDAAMVDGAALLMTMFHGLRGTDQWTDTRRSNLIDGGAPFYRTYETLDGKYLAVGAIEPKFYADLLQRIGLDNEDLPDQMDRAGWPQLEERFATVFRQKTRDEWCAMLEDSEACCSPVLTVDEAVSHAHNRDRDSFVTVDGASYPAAAPRFSRTPGSAERTLRNAGEDAPDVLEDWGFSPDDIARLRSADVLSD